jgi:predicted AlkP superfamily phosphohydrolase/phosphomutase
MDPRHPQYEADSPFATAIHDYYVHVDKRVGELLTHCDDDTAVLVVSDHGAQPLMGGLCINEWLIAQGYLTLKEAPDQVMPLDQAAVDWGQTQVWGAGGYYARIFFNVKGREPEGTVAMADYDALRQELTDQLQTLTDPSGNPLPIKVFKPQDIYQKVRGRAPDLIVYFDDLAWRSVGSVGLNSFYTVDNDTGPDDANHAPFGLAIFHDPAQPQNGRVMEGAQLYDVLPTLLHRYGIAAPDGLRGKVW